MDDLRMARIVNPGIEEEADLKDLFDLAEDISSLDYSCRDGFCKIMGQGTDYTTTQREYIKSLTNLSIVGESLSLQHGKYIGVLLNHALCELQQGYLRRTVRALHFIANEISKRGDRNE